MIEITDDLYISKGAERKCYSHPEDTSKLIKIQYENDRDQNNLDVYYYNYLKQQSISYSHIPRCYGRIITNKGEGLIFDTIKDYNGQCSSSIESIIVKKKLPKAIIETLFEELKFYLKDNIIIFGDVVLSNI